MMLGSPLASAEPGRRACGRFSKLCDSQTGPIPPRLRVMFADIGLAYTVASFRSQERIVAQSEEEDQMINTRPSNITKVPRPTRTKINGGAERNFSSPATKNTRNVNKPSRVALRV